VLSASKVLVVSLDSESLCAYWTYRSSLRVLFVTAPVPSASMCFGGSFMKRSGVTWFSNVMCVG
jgi:hypothetical protein